MCLLDERLEHDTLILTLAPTLTLTPSRCLLDERLEQHAHRYEGLLLQCVLHVAHEELAEHRLVVVLDEREREHLEVSK